MKNENKKMKKIKQTLWVSEEHLEELQFYDHKLFAYWFTDEKPPTNDFVNWHKVASCTRFIEVED